MALETAVISTNIGTSTGNVSFTSSGFGTPTGALIYLVAANSTTNPKAYATISFGATDGTRQWCCHAYDQDNVSTTNTERYAETDTVCRGINSALAGSFNAWVTDGIQINFVGTLSNEEILIVLFKGATNTYANSVTLGTGTSPVDVTAPGFKPNVVFSSCIGSSTQDQTSYAQHGIISIGVAHIDSSDTITQGMVAWSSRDALGTGAVYDTTVRNDTCVGQLFDGTQTWKAAIVDPDASGFSYDPDVSAGDDYVYYFCMDTGNTDGVDVRIRSTPTSTGNSSETGMGFQPQLSMIFGAPVATINTIESDDDGGSLQVSAFNATVEAALGFAGDDAATTTNCESHQLDKSVGMKKWGGSTFDNLIIANYVSFDSGGDTLNYTTVDSTARQFVSVSFEDEAGGTTLSPTAGSIIYTGQTATVKTNYITKPVAGSVVYTGGLPTIITEAGVTLTPSAGSIIYTGQTATIKTEYLVKPTAGSIIYTGGLATIVEGNAVTLAPSAASIVYTGGLATLTIEYAATLTPAAANIIYTGGLATVTLARDRGWSTINAVSGDWTEIGAVSDGWTPIPRIN